MVIIEVRNGDKVIGCCDARCYNATSPECKCCCGGANHGVGLKNAQDNRRYISDSYILENIPFTGNAKVTHITKPSMQMELFK